VAGELDRAGEARRIIDGCLYMVLGTAGPDGSPWASPVWFAADGYGAFHWVSSREARHSRNIAARPEVGIVIFDSSVPVGAGQGVYVEARAEQLSGADLDRGLAVFSDKSLANGGRRWTTDDLPEDGLMRLYRASAASHSMLAKDGQPDHRVEVRLE
jgi:nitroimidazol reductase NimA-like FMN-containing flavoprotein (pyridoxamine 5'-phosphate oxidase superfamily)